VLFLLGMADSLNYIVSLWLSIAASVWLAESFLYRSRRSSMELVSTFSTRGGLAL
jgi:hypothetical protein